MIIKIICLKWGTAFVSKYVNILHNAIQKNTTLPFEFICVTDDSKGLNASIKILPLETIGIVGWWNKLYLFHPNCGLSGQILFFDLDTLITNNIDELLAYRGDFAILDQYLLEEIGSTQKAYASGIMSWRHEKMHHIWELFVKNIDKIKAGGDQQFLTEHVDKADILQILFPNRIRSYKKYAYANGMNDQTSVICFHGIPRPHQALEEINGYAPRPWVATYWS